MNPIPGHNPIDRSQPHWSQPHWSQPHWSQPYWSRRPSMIQINISQCIYRFISDYISDHKINRLPHRFLGVALLSVSLSISLSGCVGSTLRQSIPLLDTPQPTASPVVTDQQEVTTIALVMKTLTNPFFVEMEKGARRAEAELGIRLIVKTAAQETSIEQQIGIIEDLIAAEVNAIVIAPGDSTELIPVLKKAQDAGITLINIDNRLNPSRSAELGLLNVPFISVNNEQGAYLSAKFISDQIRTPTQVVILEGIRTAQNAIDRKQGALRAFREDPNIDVVATETAHWKVDEAYEVTRRLFAKYPNIGAIFCANDMMALGALRYLKETDRQNILVAGFDALEEAKQAIRTGELAVSIDQQAAEQGYLGIHYAAKACCQGFVRTGYSC
ncbi:MAG: sugar ABC transporter substrate-binding protein [Elainella sp. Prado103]|nr:sugar ABC transporter substrate-binding protein [Elainella sp. Prado103]